MEGRRKVNPNSKNTAWRHQAFRGYANYMEINEFKEGIEELEKSITTNYRLHVCILKLNNGIFSLFDIMFLYRVIALR